MVHFSFVGMLSIGLILLGTAFGRVLFFPECKSVPGTPDWPSDEEWWWFNKTISGRLISPKLPGGVCHRDQPNFNTKACASFATSTDWNSIVNDPVHNAYNNWNNDTCLPDSKFPCSADGYPIFVVNATKPEHVRAAVNFARENNIRLIVKGSGHDFRGRSVAPNALSIWVRHLRGLKIHQSFTPQGRCKRKSLGPGMTIAAGEDHGSAFAEANKYQYMLNVGGGPTVGPGGYATGGGHSLISFQYGLAADNILEATVVTASGAILVANECQHPNLFWALRGGGGSTVGVILSMTVRVYPSEMVTDHTVQVYSSQGSKKFWDMIAYISAQAPQLVNNRVMYHAFITPQNETSGPSLAILFRGLNLTAVQTARVLDPIWKRISSTSDNELMIEKQVKEYPTLYSFWSTNPDDTTPIGIDLLVGSRILDEKALKSRHFKRLIQEAVSPQFGLQMFLASGPGVHKQKRDFNAVVPAWRTGYLHVVLGASWPPFNSTAQTIMMDEVTNKYSAALRKLAPDMGCYLNEANAFEPNFQRAFWGTNYRRLLKIKESLDPEDVFWCRSCAGSEGWEEDEDLLCRVSDDDEFRRRRNVVRTMHQKRARPETTHK